MNAANMPTTFDVPGTDVQRDVAIREGLRMAAKIFAGRKGHANTKGVSERHLKEGQLALMLAAAYMVGAEQSQTSMVTALRTVRDLLGAYALHGVAPVPAVVAAYHRVNSELAKVGVA